MRAMIRYSLKCGAGHYFDDWFSNSADYDAKAAANELACPDCGDRHVGKAIMAPNVAKSGSAPAAGPAPCGAPMGCGGGACAFANDF